MKNNCTSTMNKRRPAALTLILASVLAILPFAAYATPTIPVLTVKNTNNAGDNSLRDVIANARDGDVITFNIPTTDTGYDAETGTWSIKLVSQISITLKNLTIDGGAGIKLTKDDALEFRLLFCNADNGTLTLRNLTIENGYYVGSGGGCYIFCDANLINCTFTGNKATLDGGGLYVNGTAALTGCVFSGNKISGSSGSGRGGGLYANRTATLTGCTFTDNTVTSPSTSMGGGVFINNTAVTMTDCVFSGNMADDGGACYNYGSLKADNCTFFNNTAGRSNGSGIIHAGTMTLRHCTFTNNRKSSTATVYNVFLSGTSISIENCLMTKDGLNDNCSDGTTTGILSGATYSTIFGNNIITFNYIMPQPGQAGGAVVIDGCETDAAGNSRGTVGSPCLYGAVNWTAKSWMVTNSSENTATPPVGSLRKCVADAEADTGTENKRVVYFDTDNTSDPGSIFNILTGSEISFGKDIMIIGRLGKDGKPEITVDAQANNYRVFSHAGASGTSYFYGLNIKNGKPITGSGGGVNSAGHVFAQSVFFTGNKAVVVGGGLYTFNSVTLTGCVFNNNEVTGTGGSEGNGGGLYAGSTAKLTGCVFNNNSAKSGGGVFTFANATLIDCAFTGNTATDDGGGIYTGSNSLASLTGCTFTSNTTTGRSGGGMYAASTDKTAQLTGCAFFDNEAGNNGGGLYVYFSSDLTGCTFSGNTATVSNVSRGGGMYANSTSTLKDCLFNNNTVNNLGGGLFVNKDTNLSGCVFTDNTSINGDGGAVSVPNGTGSPDISMMTFINCALSGNSSGCYGGAVYAYNSKQLVMINCTLSDNTTVDNDSYGCAINCAKENNWLFHCTVTGNTGGGIFAYDTPASLYNCIVAGNTDYAGTGSRQMEIYGSGVISSASSLVEGQPIPGSSPSVDVIHLQVFGLNTFDAASGTHRVLTNGIAAGKATAFMTADVAALTGLTATQKQEIDDALALDQLNAARLRTGAVTYGAVEAGENALTNVAVKTGTAVKTSYDLNESLNFSSGKLILTYTGGSTTEIDMTAPGVTNDAAANITASAGSKAIKFTYCGVETDPGLIITVNTYTASISPFGTYTFSTETYGYDHAALAKQFTITNTGTAPITGLNVSLGASSDFEISSALSTSTVASGGTATFSIRPKSRLSANPTPHTDAVTIRWNEDGGTGLTVNLSFTVNPKAITVTANSGQSTYGQSPSNPGISATGLVYGETVSVLTDLKNNFNIHATVPPASYSLEVIGNLANSNYIVTARYMGIWRVYKVAGAAVGGIPTLAGIPSGIEIVINPVTIPDNPGNQTVEYAVSTFLYASEGMQNTLKWQTGTTFTGPFAEGTYYVYARSAANEYYAAGTAQISDAIVLTLTGIDDVQPAKTLIAWVQNDRLYVSGLTPGKPWSVYNISGMLMYQSIAENDKADISLPAQGVYIVRSENEVVKTKN